MCAGLSFQACNVGNDYLKVPSNERQILWVSVPGQMGMTQMPSKAGLDVNNTISVQVLPDVDISALPVELAISPGAKVVPASGEPQDFRNGPVEYTVTSQTGIDRKFKVEVSVFEEIFIGKWRVASVNVISDMDKEYGTPIWPAPGLGQKTGSTIVHNASTPVYTPVTDGVELDNTLTFKFTEIDSNGNAAGDLITDPGADGKIASRKIVSDFLEEINVIYDAAEAYHYPDDILWIPGESGTRWTHNVSTGTITFQSGSSSLKCTVSNSGDDEITLTLPSNPNRGDVYKRPHNGWFDRYDFVYNTVYKLERISK